MTKVVNLRKEKYDIYIGRGSIYGNPFIIGRDGTREEVIEKYRNYVPTNKLLIENLSKLKDKILGWFCKPLACHGDVLVEFIEKGYKGTVDWKTITRKIIIVDKED